ELSLAQVVFAGGSSLALGPLVFRGYTPANGEEVRRAVRTACSTARVWAAAARPVTEPGNGRDRHCRCGTWERLGLPRSDPWVVAAGRHDHLRDRLDPGARARPRLLRQCSDIFSRVCFGPSPSLGRAGPEHVRSRVAAFAA